MYVPITYNLIDLLIIFSDFLLYDVRTLCL
jgi:hypothetical protein